MEDMMQTTKNSQSGFSLVELLVAVVILAVGLLGLSELQFTAMRANTKSQGILVATSLAQEVIEQVTARSGSDPMFDGPSGTGLPWEGGEITVADGSTYNVTYDLETEYQGVTNLCRVRVNVVPANAVNIGVFTRRGVSMTTLKRSS
jgi:prepilin-type N-terminal cleavage/methylation domain-containing protein